MQQLTFAIIPKTADLYYLRLLDATGKQVLGERELDRAVINELTDVVETYYQRRMPTLARLGQHLYQWLDGATERWLTPLAEHADGTVIYIDVAEQLRHLPWELLNQQGIYLCQNAHRPFTPIRLVKKSERKYARENRPLRLLFMACSAEDVQPVLHYEHEESCILAAAAHSDIELVVEERGSQAGLAERLNDYGDDNGKGYFDVFHLTGHADVDGETRQPFFWMEDDLGYGVRVTADELARAFAGNWPRLVFLSGCKTAQSAEAGLLPSFCEALVAAGAPAVLGWALPVSDAYATEAAAELYKHLAAGKRIDEAVARARVHLLENQRDDWHLLRLYADRTPPTEIVTPPRARRGIRSKVREARAEWLDENQRSEVCPRSQFIGRRRPLQRCLRALTSREGEAHYEPGVLIHGMGGLGKSSLAARLCDRLPHRRLMWYGTVDELGFTAKLGDKLASVEVNQMLSQPLPLRQRVQRLFDAGVFDEPALLIFDDFEQNLEPDVSGGWQLKKEALDVLTALLAAIRHMRSDSRVLITSRYRFPLPHPLRLYEEGLESLTAADLSKKLRQLDEKYEERLAQGIGQTDSLLARAVSLGAGNPRLLDRLYLVVADAATDHEALLAALEGKAAEFREEIFLRELLERQTPACRQLIAAAALVRLPIDRAALETLAGPVAVDPHLERAVTLGLLEAGTIANPQTGGYEKHYFVSDLLLPLLADELSDTEAHAARQRAAQHLYQQWWVATKSRNLEQTFEVHQLALLAGEQEIAVELCHSLASAWIYRAQYREAVALCEVTLALGQDYRVLLQLARAEKVLGLNSARSHYEQALAQCPASDRATRSAIIYHYAELLLQQGEVLHARALWQETQNLAAQIGEVSGVAAMQHQIACLLAQQGEVEQALELWQESQAFTERIGDKRGKAAILASRAIVIAMHGEIEQSLELLQEALDLKKQVGDTQGEAAVLAQIALVRATYGKTEQAQVQARALLKEALARAQQIGDAQGMAETMAIMAWVEGQSGDFQEAIRLNWEAGRALARGHAWLSLVTVLGNLGALSNDVEAVAFIVQAFWLTLRVSVPLDKSVNLAGDLVIKLGPAAEAAPLVAAGAVFFAHTRGERHPEREAYQQGAFNMLVACAGERGITTQEAFDEWVKREGLVDPQRFVPRLEAALVALVDEQEWLFDRALVGN